jgi:hypothetical protein
MYVPIIAGCDEGPSPSILAAVTVTLMFIEETHGGMFMKFSQASFIQDDIVMVSNASEEGFR